MEHKAKVLVTGGAGFIGSHVAEQYIGEGYETHIVDNLSLGDPANIPDTAQFFELDIRDAQIDDLLSRNRYHCINHHAAQINVRESVRDPMQDVDVNVLGTIHLLQLAVKYNVSYFIFASSGGAVYGEQNYFPADEDHPTHPDSPYGINKLTAEKYLHYYHKAYGLRYSALRYTNVYGPRQNPAGEAGVISIFIDRLLQDELAIINGDGTQTRDYVHVADVAKANLFALEHMPVGSYNICTGLETDVNTIYHKVAAAMSKAHNPVYGPPKTGEQMRSVCSYQKASAALQWAPLIDLDQGIESTCQYFTSEKYDRKS